MSGCQGEHVAHVEPSQKNPRRFWLTCDGVQFAELHADGSMSMDGTAEWFRNQMDDHLGERSRAG